MIIPTPEEIRALHLRHAPSQQAFDRVYGHCEIVWHIARQLLDGLGSGPTVDRDLVRAGCLLHDIGVYRLFDGDGGFDGKNYIRHGVLGHGILRDEGFPEALCRFCSCHTGVGLTADDIVRQGLPLPVADYSAVSEEERLVMYADKFHSKSTPPRFHTADTYAAYVGRFGADKTDAFTALRKDFGEPDVLSLAETYGQTAD